MSVNLEHAALREELRDAAHAFDAAEVGVAGAQRQLATRRDALMETLHRAKCAGLSWRVIVIAVCDGLGLSRPCATSLEGACRRQLTEWRADNGLLPCPPPRVRTTTTEEFG